MAALDLGDGSFALVDDEDYEAASQFRWRKTEHGYVRRRFGKKQQYLHHFIIGDRARVDHKNRDRTDNRRENLRHATSGQNGANRTAYSKSGFKGVVAIKSGWMAQITVEGHHEYLGYFPSKEEAARAYNRAAKTAFGEFAVLNERC